MTLRATLDALVQEVTKGDVTDLQHVDDVREAFVGLRSSLKGEEFAEAMEACSDALAAIETILQQETENASAEYGFLGEVLHYIDGVNIAIAGGSTTTVARPYPPGGSLGEAQDAAKVSFDPEVFDDPMLNAVLSELRSHLEAAEGALFELESDSMDSGLMDQIYRAFHTIKGVAEFLHLAPIVAVAQSGGALLGDFRKNVQPCTADHVALVIRSWETMVQLVDALEGDKLPSLGYVQELLVDLDAATAGENGQITQLAADTNERVDSSASKAPGSNSKQLPTVQAPTGAGTIAQPKSKRAAKGRLRRSNDKPVELKQPRATVGQVRGGLATEEATQVGAGRLDHMAKILGELTIAQQVVSQDENLTSLQCERLSRKLSQVAKITGDLRESIESLRTGSPHSTLQDLSRFIRDVSRESGRAIHFDCDKESSELDRAVAEKVWEPLVQIIESAVNDGSETPAVSSKKGKAQTGNLSMSAYHEDGAAIIEIHDDGQGPGRSKTTTKAEEQALLFLGKNPQGILKDEVHREILETGSSIAGDGTDDCAWDAGLEVLCREIAALRGRIEVKAERGQGKTLYILLPLTSASIEGTIVRVGTTRFVVPTHAIKQSVQPTPNQIHSIFEMETVAEFGADLLAVHSLKGRFNLDLGCDDPTRGTLLLLEAHGLRACVLVDEVLFQEQVVLRSMSEGLTDVSGTAGMAVVKDGSVALVVDISCLLAEVHGQATGPGVSSSDSTMVDVAKSASLKANAPAGKYLTFKLGQGEFGVPMRSVREILPVPEITPIAKLPQAVKGVINHRGRITPVVDLRTQLGIPAGPYDHSTCVVVTEIQASATGEPLHIGCIVNAVGEVLGVSKTAIKPTPAFGDGVDRSNLMGIAHLSAQEKVVALLDLDHALESVALHIHGLCPDDLPG